jgi:methylglutaconyl-CoA hydratase
VTNEEASGMTETVLCDIDQHGVARVTLNRPQLHNAFDEALIARLTALIQALGDDDQVRVIIIAGNGESFCAGADLNWMRRIAEQDAQANLQDALRLAQLMKVIDSVPRPTIARIHGAVYGGGVGLAACCDIALADDGARFCLSEVRLGIVPAVIAPFVVRAIGGRAARRFFLTGTAFSAAEAQRHGLVHELATNGGLDEAVDATAAQLLRGGPLALGRCKRLIAQVSDAQPDNDLMQRMAHEIAEARASAEGREGLDAFLAKRPPRWVDDVQ